MPRIHLNSAKRPAIGTFACLLFLSITIAFGPACRKPDERPAANMAAAREGKKEIARLREDIPKLATFFRPMAKPEAYDWLGSHNEPGQTFEEYLDSEPTKPTKERQKLYVLPMGTFAPTQARAIDAAAEYIGTFYDLPVEKMPAEPFKRPQSAKDKRNNKLQRREQIRTGYILDLLRPRMPADAAALVAFTNEDLFSEPAVSYVFGQASFDDRVGIWSLARFEAEKNGEKFLRRTLKIAVHETGHMFSMRHCTKYECVMSGTNHLGETDRRPLDACPECSAKICWMSGAVPAERYKRLADFCRRNGLTAEAAEFARKGSVVADR